MPNYIIKLENDLFEKTYGSRHKEIATWGGARIAWVNEMTKKKQDAEFLKNLSDGTSVRYKVMYGEMDTMPISFKLFYVGNHSMRVEADNGIGRRMKVLQMDSDFVDGLVENDYENKRFIRDRNFREKLATTHKHALLSLIFQYSKMYIDEGNIKPHPDDWSDETKDVCADNNKFTIWFDEHFETGDLFKICKKDFESIVKVNDMGDINVKDELKRMRINFRYDSQMREGGKKGFYIGFRHIPNTIADNA
jgi:phage/plasmid-associated DNA primase